VSGKGRGKGREGKGKKKKAKKMISADTASDRKDRTRIIIEI